MNDTTTDKSAATRAPRDDLISDLIRAAMTYGVVADWFESRPVPRWRRLEEHEAELARMDLFNAIEADLRIAARNAINHNGNRETLFMEAVEKHATKIGEKAVAPMLSPEDAAVIERVKSDEAALEELDKLYWKCKSHEARKAVVNAMRRKYNRR